MNRNHYSQMLANLTNKVMAMVKTTLWPGDDQRPLTIEVTAATELLQMAIEGLESLKRTVEDNVLHVNRSLLLPNINELRRYSELLGRCRSPLGGTEGVEQSFDAALDAMLDTCSNIARYVPGYDHPERASQPFLSSLISSKLDAVIRCVRDYYFNQVEVMMHKNQNIALCAIYAVLARMESPILMPGQLPRFDATAYDEFLIRQCSITYSMVKVAGSRYRQLKNLYQNLANEIAAPSLSGQSPNLQLFYAQFEAFDRLLTSSLHPVASLTPLPESYCNPECPSLPDAF